MPLRPLLPGFGLIIVGCATPASRGESVALHPAVEEARRRQLPGVQHRALDAFIGTWSTDWHIESGPNSPVETPRGTVVFTRDMNGRFVFGCYEGGPVIGRAFQARLVLGYDFNAQEYVASWVNSFETRIAVYTGSGEARPTGELMMLELTGPAPPHPGRQPGALNRSVFLWTSPNEFVEEGFLVESGGSERRALRVVYRRIR